MQMTRLRVCEMVCVGDGLKQAEGQAGFGTFSDQARFYYKESRDNSMRISGLADAF